MMDILLSMRPVRASQRTSDKQSPFRQTWQENYKLKGSARYRLDTSHSRGARKFNSQRSISLETMRWRDIP